MPEAVEIAEAAKDLAGYVGRVSETGEPLILTRNGRAVAELRSVSACPTVRDLPEIMKAAPHLSAENAEAFAGDLEEIRTEASRRPEHDPWAS